MTGEEVARRPRVVLFRPSPIDRDTRAKKFALALHRAGYEPVVLSPVAPGEPCPELRLGPVRVVQLELRSTAQEDLQRQLLARRRRTFRPFTRITLDEYRTRLHERRQRVRRAQRLVQGAKRDVLAGSPRARARGAVRLVPVRLLLVLRLLQTRVLIWRQRGNNTVNRRVREGWRRFDTARRDSTFLATDRGVLPELDDIAASFAAVLDELQPDVLHAHHPTVLPTAVRAARRQRSLGRPAAVVYDARENFAGIPEGEQGSVRRHAVLVRQEARYIREVDAVITVSEPIADELQQRYGLAQRPAVVLNAPVLVDRPTTSSVRREAGLDDDVPLLVYSGGLSRARGIETLVDAMAHLPGVHLVLVTVPYPHPMLPQLRERAAELGVADRLIALPPVEQDELVGFLSSADVAVHPLPGGSPNHDQAMPNKLFEYLHAGLPLVVSDARSMAEFVTTYDLGEVFPSHDAVGLADAVRRALARPADAAARQALAERFSWQGQEDAVAEVYRRVAPTPVAANRSEPFPSLDVKTLDEEHASSSGSPAASLGAAVTVVEALHG